MTPALALALEKADAVFAPGARLTGVASWTAPTPPRALELRLLYVCSGKGGRDLKIVQTVPLVAPRAAEARAFSLTLPLAPFSFTGALVSLAWTLELVASPGEDKVSVALTLAPAGEPLVLAPARLPAGAGSSG
ncbi:MAG: hypothetical protein JWM82_2974 [Myxococcales bacterium]|nr:hypothetical protein [Myxococcales bacterium]